MTVHTNKLIQNLSTEYTKLGFAQISVALNALPDKIKWLGGIEKKTLNLHRAICIFEYTGGVTSFYNDIIDTKESLHKCLRAKFWRGLGIGLIVFSKYLIDDETLKKTVYSAEKVSTTIIQWIVNLPYKSNWAKVAPTLSEVSTTSMVNEMLDLLEIPFENRTVLLSEKVSPFKMKLF